jgi:hypothetical protein
MVAGAVSEGERVTYEVDEDVVGRSEAITACTAVLELRRPRLVRQRRVDAHRG